MKDSNESKRTKPRIGPHEVREKTDTFEGKSLPIIANCVRFRWCKWISLHSAFNNAERVDLQMKMFAFVAEAEKTHTREETGTKTDHEFSLRTVMAKTPSS